MRKSSQGSPLNFFGTIQGPAGANGAVNSGIKKVKFGVLGHLPFRAFGKDGDPKTQEKIFNNPDVAFHDLPFNFAFPGHVADVEAGGMGNVADEKLRSRIMGVAKKAKIQLQIEVVEGGATDAASVYGVRGGIPSIALGIPARYIHSNVSVCSLKDIEKTVEFLVQVGKADLG